MTLAEIAQLLKLEVLTTARDFTEVTITQGYASDLLSRVLAEAPRNGIWVTLQAHANIVAVGALLELSAIIITEGARPDQDTLAKANHEGLTLLATSQPTFNVVGRLWELGLKNS